MIILKLTTLAITVLLLLNHCAHGQSTDTAMQKLIDQQLIARKDIRAMEKLLKQLDEQSGAAFAERRSWVEMHFVATNGDPGTLRSGKDYSTGLLMFIRFSASGDPIGAQKPTSSPLPIYCIPVLR